jgi:DNA invertase Pin-like site-specific DNA recombinase
VSTDGQTSEAQQEALRAAGATVVYSEKQSGAKTDRAAFERHLILSRTNEGRIRAKARGVKFGRRPKLTKHQQAEAKAGIAQGETLTAVARSYNVSHMTIRRLDVTYMS